MPVTLQENLRGLLYAPYYAALSLDAYGREGVTVGLVAAPSPAEAVAGLFNGTVDVAWGGPMRVMHTYDQRPDCDLVCFGEAVTRDPFGRPRRATGRSCYAPSLRTSRSRSIATTRPPISRCAGRAVHSTRSTSLCRARGRPPSAPTRTRSRCCAG